MCKTDSEASVSEPSETSKQTPHKGPHIGPNVGPIIEDDKTYEFYIKEEFFDD